MKALAKLLLGALMLAGAAAAVAPAAEAAWYGPGPRSYGPPRAHFGFGFGPAWRGGRWVHGWHGPRYGWWWTVGSSWYLYPRPVYPYPAYAPPPVDDYYYDYGADGPGGGRDYGQGYAQGSGGNPQPPAYWYFCRNPEGYYPYVHDCDDWQQEPAQGAVPPGDYPEYSDPDFRGEP
jgi:hypothetical protein